MSSHSSENGSVRLTRRQALGVTTKAIASAISLATLAPLPGNTLELDPQQSLGLPQRGPTPTVGAQKLRIASCQFPVSSKIAENAKYIQSFMCDAAGQGAHLLHTSEGALSGYGGPDVASFAKDKFDWDSLRKETSALRTLADSLKIYLVLGSAHFLDEVTKPTNCVYLISPTGAILDRYDKSFLTGRDQQYYSAGSRRVIHDIRGVRIGLAICYDICWPQLYIAYRELGATVMLHSMYNARDEGRNRLDTLNTYEVPTRCADNRLWAVCNNSSQPYSHWGSFIARPDATIFKQLGMNQPGMLIHDFPDIPADGEVYFNLKPMRSREDEVMSWGTVSNHARQRDGRCEP